MLSVNVLFFAVSVYIIYNLYNKNVIYETWTEDIIDRVSTLKESVKEIDSRNIFEKDDDVGVVFDEIASLVDSFDHNLKDKDNL